MNQFITAADVRTFANITGNSGRYSDGSIGSNILAAQGFLQRETGRLFEKRDSTTLTFTSEGRAQVSLPDLRSASSVVSNGSTLTANESYWLLPDAKQSGVYVAIQLRAFGNGDTYQYHPDWFDRNLRGIGYSSPPNDLAITGNWGWDPLPFDVLHAVKVLAAWYTKRADGLLAGAVQGPDGSILDYSLLPTEATAVIRDYRRGEQATIV